MSNLAVIASAGAILSASVQAEIEELLPDVMIINSFGTSESGDLGRAAGDEESHEGRPSFYMGDEVTVLERRWRADSSPARVKIGLGRALGSACPSATTRTQKKTAERFKEFKGKRWVVPRRFRDGRVRRAASPSSGARSKCINTGGEKVFPEEVEEALKAHPAHHRCARGRRARSSRFGSKVAAVFNTRGNKELITRRGPSALP